RVVGSRRARKPGPGSVPTDPTRPAAGRRDGAGGRGTAAGRGAAVVALPPPPLGAGVPVEHPTITARVATATPASRHAIRPRPVMFRPPPSGRPFPDDTPPGPGRFPRRGPPGSDQVAGGRPGDGDGGAGGGEGADVDVGAVVQGQVGQAPPEQGGELEAVDGAEGDQDPVV